jgi:deoxyribodipyrimidine photo-lyase
MRKTGAAALYVNDRIEPWYRQHDAAIESALAVDELPMHRFIGSTLFDPDTVRKADGTPYRVFTPFYRKGCLLGAPPPREPLAAPAQWEKHTCADSSQPGELGLIPEIAWYGGLAQEWQVGEAGALKRLDTFLESGLGGYREGRNRPDLRHVSRLSPHLHFGEISPNQVWHAVLPRLADPALARDVDSFMSELGWREFSHYLLRHWPGLPTDNLQSKFDRFPWQTDRAALERWQRGQTGYPIVDAGMRELWETGFMHNRVRMIVGSFLVKNLLQHWRTGEAWFWDTLVDADLANNSAGWQWVAGSGADAAPYFRIFNPVTQGRKFDPDGAYVRRFVPELASLGPGDIHAPWEARTGSGRSLDYPDPIVDLKASRERALAAFRSISG